MNIALIGPVFPFRGGISQYTTLLSRELAEKHRVLTLSFKRQYPGFLYPGQSNYDHGGIPFGFNGAEFIIDSMNPLSWERAARRLMAFHPDIVIFQWWVAFWAFQFYFIAKRLKQMRRSPEVVFICHNVVEHESNVLKKWSNKVVFSSADRFVTHCAEETNRLKALMGEGCPVQTAFHPTYDAYCVNVPGRDEARRRLGLSGDILLFFGFVRKYKGLDVLLKALSRVVARRPVYLMVVGEFWEDKEPYLEMIRQLHLERFVTIVDEYVSNETAGLYFSAADLVVQPYLRASGSGVAQLAYGFERPVIASDVGSLSEVIIDGENGRLVAPGDFPALAGAILASLEPAVLKGFEAASRETKKRFSWEGLIEKVLADGGPVVNSL